MQEIFLHADFIPHLKTITITLTQAHSFHIRLCYVKHIMIQAVHGLVVRSEGGSLRPPQ